MSAVDVLAVVEQAENRAREDGYFEFSGNLADARAAMAELIDADKCYDEARTLTDNLRDGVSTIGEVVRADAYLKRTKTRRAAALARAGGAA